MPVEIQGFSPEQLSQFFGRRARGAEDVEDYIKILEAQKMAIGKGFGLKTSLVKAEGEDEEPYTILTGSIDDDDPAGVTIRAAKRRFNLAAKELGYKLIWREPDGWLIGKAVDLAREDADDGQAS